MDFANALDTKVDSIERPPNLPQGTYIWAVTKLPVQSTSKSGEWDIVEFSARVVSAEADVDEDDLEEFGDVTSAFNRVSFMFTKDASKQADFDKTLYRLKKFCMDTLMVDVEEGATLKEMLDASLNCQFLGSAVWRPVDDETYVDLKNYAPLD